MKVLLALGAVYAVSSITLAFYEGPMSVSMSVLQAVKSLWVLASLFFIIFED